MSHRLTCILSALLLGTAGLYGADPAPASPAEKTPAETTTEPTDNKKDSAEEAAKPEETIPPFALKNRSTFPEVPEGARPPFWPIGWVKRKPGQVATVEAAAPVEPLIQLDEKAFKVTSILIGTGTTPSLAIINGRTYSEGEFIRMPKGGPTPTARIRVHRINDGNVILQHANQVVVAALVRPELSQRKSEELLLDPDR